MAAQNPAAERPRSRAETEAEVAAAHDRLIGNLTELIDQLHPKAVVGNTASDARDFVDSRFRQLKGQFFDQNGLRIPAVALVVAAVAGAITFGFVVRSIFRDR